MCREGEEADTVGRELRPTTQSAGGGLHECTHHHWKKLVSKAPKYIKTPLVFLPSIEKMLQ